MKIIHTSDWHLGRYLNKTKKRYVEFERFLDWLAETIDRREAGALIVAGDIFDNTTPTHRAQEIYYNFLRRVIVGSKGCRHVVIVGGNHDSPSFLEAPAKLLRGMGVHVLGAKDPGDPGREVLPLRDQRGRLEMIVCAAPFLRESDLRTAELGDAEDDRHRKIVLGLGEHYRGLSDMARKIMAENGAPVPIVATGHLFLKGSVTSTDDGVREIHAGPLSALPLDVLPRFDYLALGHLHSAQSVGKIDTVRYSGSPIPMGFNEAKGPKSVCLVEFGDGPPKVELIEVPVFQTLKRLEGDLESLVRQIKALSGTGAWLEVVHAGSGLTGDLRRCLDEAIAGTDLEMLTVKDNERRDLLMSAEAEPISLNDLSISDIFGRLLKDSKVPEDQWPALRAAHAQLVSEIETHDVLAE
ncbi:MAG: exonuclease SbcCD subunit D C-terminal domain-containing protein [Deltaproteobacteria bacterium]|jgi:exonuclease SbcD|nr:exonuclease SbcCD subunit D C-terminal domain-containing protein [Deltaproteobacteria bacterium]